MTSARPKVGAVIAAMEVLLTKQQIESLKDMTSGGWSKLEAIRHLINRGIMMRETERRRMRETVEAMIKAQAKPTERPVIPLGDAIIIRTPSRTESLLAPR